MASSRLKKLFDWVIPSPPAPFEWVATMINEYAIKPVKRVIQEIKNAFEIGYSDVLYLWNNHDLIWAKFRVKLQTAASAAYSWAKQLAGDLYNQAVSLVSSVWTHIWGAIWPVINWLTSVYTTLQNWITNWINSVYNAFVNAYYQWKAIIDYFVFRFQAFTDDIIRYWVNTYWSYRTRLSDFLSDPARFIVAYLIDAVGRLALDMCELGGKVLDKVW